MSSPEKKTLGGEASKRRDPREGVYVTKLDADVTAKVVQAIRGGASLDTASKFAGIERRTFQRWLAAGRRGLEQSERPSWTEEDAVEAAPFIEFISAIDEALASFKLSITSAIYAAGQGKDGQPGQWQAFAWLGERRFPDEFGRRQRVEHANADGQPFALSAAPSIDPSKLSDDELDALIALMEKAKPEALGSSNGAVPHLPPGAIT